VVSGAHPQPLRSLTTRHDEGRRPASERQCLSFRQQADQRPILRSLVELLQHDELDVRNDVLRVMVRLSADHATYAALLHSGGLQGTLDLLERSTLTAESLHDPSIGGAAAGRRAARLVEAERQSALQILANLARHDISLLNLFEDHPALDGVVLPQAQSGVGVRGGQASFMQPSVAGRTLAERRRVAQ